MQEERRIKRLPEEVVNKIAAGEVVQRPGSALKEMVENSIDAHATNIVVTINKGGLKQMQIQDNGDGIQKDDLPILCERYTTSKLRAIDDLNKIQTFGFRGEALASISTVSHVMVVTKRADDICGWKVRYNGNQLIDNKIEATASTQGTCITVDDLFYNIPLRQNMYNTKESDETKYILLLMQVFSIHYAPQGISFTLKELPNKLLFKSIKATSLAESISNVLGASVKPLLKEISIEREPDVECPFAAEMLICPKMPTMISSSLSFILFVNGRYIQNTRIRQGIKRVLEQYYYCSDTNSKSRNQNTFCYICLTIDSHLVDVNVHPNKKEICFLDEDYVVNRIVTKVEEAVEKIVNSQTIGQVNQPKKSVKQTSDSPIVYANKKVRVDHSQRKISFTSSPSRMNDSSVISLDDSQGESPKPSPSQSLLTDSIISTPVKETREDLQLHSIAYLRDKVSKMGALCTYNKELLSKSIFISCLVHASMGIIQFENELYLLKLSDLLHEYFYQVILTNFGCFYPIQLTSDTLSIKSLLQADQEHVDIEKSIQLLTDFAPMLEDYFAITLIHKDNELYLKALPMLIASYEPYYGYLPVFIRRLVTQVNFNDEKECLQGIARELALFYSYIPKGEEEEEWKSIVQTVLYPQMKRQLIVFDAMWNKGSIQLMASTDRLYRVFERCCDCLLKNRVLNTFLMASRLSF